MIPYKQEFLLQRAKERTKTMIELEVAEEEMKYWHERAMAHINETRADILTIDKLRIEIKKKNDLLLELAQEEAET